MSVKKYSAFISSNYETLKKERAEVINCLLNHQMIPICMEHFTTAANNNFFELEKLIDQSDIFIMILGDCYGSCDSDGKSWTQREYEYAVSKNMPVFVLLNGNYTALSNAAKNGEELTDSQKRQLEFGDSILFKQEITEQKSINVIMGQIISSVDFSDCSGWERKSEKDAHIWQTQNKFLDISGKWYHVHLKEENSDYIRVGTLNIAQRFDKENFAKLTITAHNYNVKSYISEDNSILPDKLKRTVWSGEYDLKENGEIIGIYEAHREFKGEYDDWVVDKGIYRGIHEFYLIDDDNDEDSTDVTTMIQGTFHDVAPSQKNGLVYLFRDEKERNSFLKENFNDVLRSKSDGK